MTTVKRENVIEIVDSNDEADDIQTKIPARPQNAKETAARGNVINSNRQNRNVQPENRSVENIGDTAAECGSNQDQNKSRAATQDKINGSNEMEIMDEMEIMVFPSDTFDSNLQTSRIGTKSHESKKQSSTSSNATTISEQPEQSRSRGYRFKCKDCSHVFKSKGDLGRHRPIHANGRLIGIKADSRGMYHCVHCIRQFTNASYLSKHMKLHQDGRYSHNCARCMHPFDQEAEKVRHESKSKGHHYECHLCKVFVTKYKSLMLRHMQTHSGTKPFRCMVCTKLFQQKNNLVRHLKSAHGRRSR